MCQMEEARGRRVSVRQGPSRRDKALEAVGGTWSDGSSVGVLVAGWEMDEQGGWRQGPPRRQHLSGEDGSH